MRCGDVGIATKAVEEGVAAAARIEAALAPHIEAAQHPADRAVIVVQQLQFLGELLVDLAVFDLEAKGEAEQRDIGPRHADPIVFGGAVGVEFHIETHLAICADAFD